LLLAVKLARRLVWQGIFHRFPDPIDRDPPSDHLTSLIHEELKSSGQGANP
jgi:hypothetical protein